MYSKFEFLKNCEAELLVNIPTIFDNFATEIETKLIIKSNTLSWIEINFTNSKNDRSLQFVLTEGINAEMKQSYSINFKILKVNSNKEVISFFSIRDYCCEKNLPFKLEQFYTDTPNFLNDLRIYLRSINEVIQIEELKSVLFFDNWIDIRPNFTPYK